MDKKALGKARAQALDDVLKNLLDQNDDALRLILKKDLLRGEKLARGKLAEMVGLGCTSDTFRQNPETLGVMIGKAEKALAKRGLIRGCVDAQASATTVEIGQTNEGAFLAWLRSVGTFETPAPMSHLGRLYRKALWAMYSKQKLLDVRREPNWFRTRLNVRNALDALDVKVVRGEVEVIKMDAESIADDLEDSMTSVLVRKQRSEIKALKEQLAVEREARLNAELEVKQNELLATFVPTGKMPHKQ